MHSVEQCCWAHEYSAFSVGVAAAPQRFCVQENALKPFCSQFCTHDSHCVHVVLLPQLVICVQHWAATHWSHCLLLVLAQLIPPSSAVTPHTEALQTSEQQSPAA